MAYICVEVLHSTVISRIPFGVDLRLPSKINNNLLDSHMKTLPALFRVIKNMAVIS